MGYTPEQEESVLFSAPTEGNRFHKPLILLIND
jgi:hypothetical protein